MSDEKLQEIAANLVANLIPLGRSAFTLEVDETLIYLKQVRDQTEQPLREIRDWLLSRGVAMESESLIPAILKHMIELAEQREKDTEQRVRRETLEWVARKRCQWCRKGSTPTEDNWHVGLGICGADVEQEELRRAAEHEPKETQG